MFQTVACHIEAVVVATAEEGAVTAEEGAVMAVAEIEEEEAAVMGVAEIEEVAGAVIEADRQASIFQRIQGYVLCILIISPPTPSPF